MVGDHGEFDLLQFTNSMNLGTIIKSFCGVTGIAGGVVRMPENPDTPPSDEDELAEYRLTDPPVVNMSCFCKHIRACDAGNLQCMWSDLRDSKKAWRKHCAIDYTCHMGLIDIVAPIKVAGRHVANVYLGQIRHHKLQFDSVWNRYKQLLADSKIISVKTPRKLLQRAFNDLKCTDKDTLRSYVQLANTMAELISERATRQAIFRVALQAGREVGSSLNLQSGLSTYLKHAISILNGDTGSIFLFNDDKNALDLYALQWGGESQSHLSMTLLGEGLLALCARNNLTNFNPYKSADGGVSFDSRKVYQIRIGTRKKIDQVCVEQFPGTRDKRKLESILIVPIICGDDFIGTLDVGSSKKNAFSFDDEHVLQLFSRQIGLYVQNLRVRHQLVNVFGKDNPDELAQMIVDSIPLEFQGIGCSIFIMHEPVRAMLCATDEFPAEKKDKIFYEVGQGFTGWILKNKKCLRIDEGYKCRTENLPQELKRQGVVWLGKYHEYSVNSNRDYYESRPFLAVPILSKEGDVCGVIRISDRVNGSFSNDDEILLKSYADNLGHQLSLYRAVIGLKRPGSWCIFLGHGQDKIAQKSTLYFLKGLGLNVEYYDKRKSNMEFCHNTFRQCLECSNAAVILVTGDDCLKSGELIARRNVIYELGVAQERFGEKTFVLLESGVEVPTNISGMQTIHFERGKVVNCFETLREALGKAGILSWDS